MTVLDLNWWGQTIGSDLAQGDLLEDCPVPLVPPPFDPSPDANSLITIEDRNLIIMTQSCDLAQNKAAFVALCAVYTLEDIEYVMPKYTKKGEWELVRQGRVEGLHMLSGIEGIEDNRSALVVDFRQIYSLPIAFLKRQAGGTGSRRRLKSPYLEHLAQAFARFFMRVGLPSSIKAFK